jgi:oxygen-independent coproporphyrinogen-3 oxidase
MGINRLSMGLQSALDSELSLLGRIHTAKDFVNTYNNARAAGFDNISADLMYGIPDQTLESLEYSARFLADLSPEHISAYGLTVEEGTYFHRHENELKLADADGQYEMYMLLSDYLRKREYHKYEISNFSKVGKESRHNLRYWRCGEYLGFGVAAHSYFGGLRFGNSRDIDAFISGADIVEESVAISERDSLSEYVMLGLRLSEGISLSEYSTRAGRSLTESCPRIAEYVRGGLMWQSDDRLGFTDRGFFVSNTVIAEILGDE